MTTLDITQLHRIPYLGTEKSDLAIKQMFTQHRRENTDETN
jgi:hypothetical protein